LVEVVIALGVAASGLLVILALVPSILKQQTNSESTYIAVGFPDAITAELKRIGGIDVTSLGARASAFENEVSSLRLVASHEGANIREFIDDQKSQFYLIELYRFPATSPLAYDSNAGFIALQARVSWPFRPSGDPNGQVAAANREWVTFNLAVNR